MADRRFRLKFRPLVPRIDEDGTLTSEFSDTHARVLQSKLKQFEGFEAWADCPRSFALLFALRNGHDMAALSASNFNDDLLPFPDDGTLPQIPGLSEPEVKDMIDYQDSFLAPLDTIHKLELFKSAGHRPISEGSIHFKFEEKLGASNTAWVGRVTHLSSGKAFACKVFVRKTADRKRPDRKVPSAYELFKNERSNLNKLKDLNHPHLINLVGTYTDTTHFALILSPAAECDLTKLLPVDGSESTTVAHGDILRRSFGCLASGLEYLHRKKIRHRDLKPGNILIHNGTIIICDLGISHESDSTNDFTYGTVNGQTHRYSSPEVLNEGPRGLMADVWSLGCVFLEIVTTLKRGTLSCLRKLFRSKPLEEDDYCVHPELISQWIKELREQDSFDTPLVWVESMLNIEPENRPSAKSLLRQIHTQSSLAEEEAERYIGSCCLGQVCSSEPGREEPQEPQQREDPRHPEQVIFRPDFNFAQPQPLPENGDHRDQNDDAQRRVSPEDITLSPEEPVDPTDRLRVDSTDGESEQRRPSESSYALRSRQNSSLTSRSTTERYFGYPSQVVRFSGTKQFCANISSFEVLSSHAGMAREMQSSILGTEIFVLVSESDDKTLWKRYRLLEIRSSERDLSESTWLPLQTLRVKLQDDNAELELQWSDCNHHFKEILGDYGFLQHRVFDSQKPNNRLRLRFLSREDAELLRQILLNRKLCHHEEEVPEGRSFEAEVKSGDHRYLSSHVHICRPLTQMAQNGERIIRTECIVDGFTTSNIYAATDERDVVLSFKGQQPTVVVSMKPLQVPEYYSDVRELPYANDKEGKFREVGFSLSKLTLEFKLEDSDVTAPTTNLKAFFHDVFGWDPVFLASVQARRTRRWLPSEPKQRAIAMLFYTSDAIEPPKLSTKLVLFFQKARPGLPKWLLGEPLETNGWGKCEYDIKIHQILKANSLGDLLSAWESQSHNKDTSSYNFEFDTMDHLQSFNKHIYEFQKAQAEQPSQSRNMSQSTASISRSTTMQKEASIS